MGTQEIYNFKRINERIMTGGQPTEAQLAAAASEGVQTVINLATFNPDHSLPDEEGVVKSLGMNYIPIPIPWNRPGKNHFEQFEQAMKTAESHKLLIHCAANYRVTAFFSLYAMKNLGWSSQQADELMSHVWKPGEYPIWDEFVLAWRAEMGRETGSVKREA